LHGVIKERDIVRSVVLENKDASKELVRDYMVTDVIITTPGEDIYEALVTMRDTDVRMLPVMDEGKFVGLLTVKDILKVQPSLFDLLAEKMILKEEGDKPIFRNRE
jgi:CBS domain-containing protein